MSGPVLALANDSTLRELLKQIDEGAVRLRFAEGLRRGWEEARAEANVQLAWAEALLDGARIDLAELRLATLQAATPEGSTRAIADPTLAQALDYWSAHRLVQSHWAPLNSRTPVRVAEEPLPRTLSQIHKVLAARLARAGKIAEADVAIPKDPPALAAVSSILGSKLPAALRAGLLIWLAVQRPAFALRSEEVARVLARHHMVTSGFEPTGVLLTSRALVGVPAPQMRAALEAPDPREWLFLYLQAMIAALDPTLDMIRHIQAGELPK